MTSSGKGKSVGKGAEGAKGHPKGQGKSKGKGKGKWKSKDREGLESGRPAESLEFEEASWEEINETDQEKWWNSWTEDVEPKRDGAHLGAFMVGGTELELNSFKTGSGEILPDEGQLALSPTRWSQMLASRACHGCSQASDLSRQGAGDLLLELLHRKLISRAMTKDTRQARSDELIRLKREDNIYNFCVKSFDGNWQAQNFDTGAAVSVLPRSYAKPVQQLSVGSRQALSAKVDPKL